MQLTEIKDKINPKLYQSLQQRNLKELRPCQEKSIKSGLFDGKNLLVCTPTGSGKTLVAEFAALDSVYNNIGKAIYIVPLKALANEKYKEFKQRYSDLKIALSVGDNDSDDSYLAGYDIIITTSEKLDSLIRHSIPWLRNVKVVIIDEIHLINDEGRGPTLEILITLLKHLLKNVQIIGLSATIGNPKELAEWLEAKLILDNWRPVKLKKGVYFEGKIEFEQ
ncbi:DEAD/DEAH box helicase [Candidatus Woesearchaeota archaeon]|nr:DEAD/DEAH box helicase [Candidatus Woesearchaeota archaeon]